jgi:AAA+ superfamily predicted ATPase
VPSSTDPLSELQLLVRSRYSLIRVAGAEESRVEELIEELARAMALPLFTWTSSKGLRRSGLLNSIYDTARPEMALAHLEAAGIPAIYHFEGLGHALADPAIAARLRDAAAVFGEQKGAIILSSIENDFPDSLRDLVTTFELPAPAAADYAALVDRVVRELSHRAPVRLELGAEERSRLIANLNGLTLLDAERILTRAILEDGRLSAEDLQLVVKAKREMVERDGLLEYFAPERSLSEVVGIDGLKAWLAERRRILAEPERAAAFGLSFPRGILLLGVPGCGKSLCAKAVARDWALPLLRLDTGALYDKYVGETEKHFRVALSTADRLSPIVLWIDEIEKAFASASGSEDGGLSTRVLGGFLSWLQERKSSVFVVATANDIQRLPPELLRKGRFDEIFFVDLPDERARRELFRLYLSKRGQSSEKFDVEALAAAAAGFSGAEIEQAVVSALYGAFSSHGELSTATLLDELSRTRPLSRTMGERLDALRAWARDRTVPAAGTPAPRRSELSSAP